MIFVTGGQISLTIDGTAHSLGAGGYAYIPAGAHWTIEAQDDGSNAPAVFHWVRKHYVAVEGLDAPEAFVTSDAATDPTPMPDCDGIWATTRFVDPADLRHDMHVNIVTLHPGGVIPFAETHVMEHGLFVLQGQGDYLLNRDWVTVGPGDFHVASRLLPAGLPVHRRGAVPLPALQGCEPAYAAQPRRADAGALTGPMTAPGTPLFRQLPAPADYAATVAAMAAHAAAIRAGTADEEIWLLEHHPVLTGGTSANEADLINPGDTPVHTTGRGGQWTWHGPGQRVAYVMLDLPRAARCARLCIRARRLDHRCAARLRGRGPAPRGASGDLGRCRRADGQGRGHRRADQPLGHLARRGGQSGSRSVSL